MEFSSCHMSVSGQEVSGFRGFLILDFQIMDDYLALQFDNDDNPGEAAPSEWRFINLTVRN